MGRKENRKNSEREVLFWRFTNRIIIIIIKTEEGKDGEREGRGAGRVS